MASKYELLKDESDKRCTRPIHWKLQNLTEMKEDLICGVRAHVHG